MYQEFQVKLAGFRLHQPKRIIVQVKNLEFSILQTATPNDSLIELNGLATVSVIAWLSGGRGNTRSKLAARRSRILEQKFHYSSVRGNSSTSKMRELGMRFAASKAYMAAKLACYLEDMFCQWRRFVHTRARGTQVYRELCGEAFQSIDDWLCINPKHRHRYPPFGSDLCALVQKRLRSLRQIPIDWAIGSIEIPV